MKKEDLFMIKQSILLQREKRILNMKQLGKDKSNKSVVELFKVMKEWNYSIYGKITIKSLSKIASKNRKTVQKYYKELKAKLIPIMDQNIKNQENILKYNFQFHRRKNFVQSM
ncbi:hypothetical protein [Chryseobacterium sp. Marseille-Q8038]